MLLKPKRVVTGDIGYTGRTLREMQTEVTFRNRLYDIAHLCNLPSKTKHSTFLKVTAPFSNGVFSKNSLPRKHVVDITPRLRSQAFFQVWMYYFHSLIKFIDLNMLQGGARACSL